MELQPLDHRRLERLVESARSRFNRVLVTWAGDVLELRRRDRLVPRWADSAMDAPGDALSQGALEIEPMTTARGSSSRKAA